MASQPSSSASALRQGMTGSSKDDAIVYEDSDSDVPPTPAVAVRNPKSPSKPTSAAGPSRSTASRERDDGKSRIKGKNKPRSSPPSGSSGPRSRSQHNHEIAKRANEETTEAGPSTSRPREPSPAKRSSLPSAKLSQLDIRPIDQARKVRPHLSLSPDLPAGGDQGEAFALGGSGEQIGRTGRTSMVGDGLQTLEMVPLQLGNTGPREGAWEKPTPIQITKRRTSHSVISDGMDEAGPSRTGKRVRQGSAIKGKEVKRERNGLGAVPSAPSLAPPPIAYSVSGSSVAGSSLGDDPFDVVSQYATPDPLDVISAPITVDNDSDRDSLDRALDEVFPRSQADEDVTMADSLPLGSSNSLMQASPGEVAAALTEATQGVDEVDLDAGSSSDGPTPPREIGVLAQEVRARFEGMSRPEKRAFIANDGKTDMEETEALLDQVNSERSSSSSNNPSSVDGIDFTISHTYPPPPARVIISLSPSPEPGTDTFYRPDEPPPEFRGTVRRDFVTDMIDTYNDMKPTLTANPALHRSMFQQWMSEATAEDEPQASEIGVVNTVGGEGGAPDMEFQYGNEMMYWKHVPSPELGLGCGCEGPCDPNDKGCRCVGRQELYFYATQLTGFAYNEEGAVKNLSVPVWECGPKCGCPPSCPNRVIQRGRSADTQLEIFKTRHKGWGVRARSFIPIGTFLGIYSGELIPDYESERRGHLYNQIGRTYLFDCDGWQIRNPPDLAKLRKVDPRLADLAEQSVKRFKLVAERAEEAEMDYYSAYSVDAFHYGFTRYFNHSCDPNLAITQAYVKDYHPERPKLVIFTRRPIHPGEEMCISYMGIPDDDDEDEPVRPVSKTPKGKGKNRSRQVKNKTSATAHVAEVKAGDDTAACRCGAKNCKGTMFAIDASRANSA